MKPQQTVQAGPKNILTMFHFLSILLISAALASANNVEPKTPPTPPGSGEALHNELIREDNTMISLFMCGDVMLGRGIDQILPHPNNPILYEPYVRDAREYVTLAESTNGPIKQPYRLMSPNGETDEPVSLSRLKALTSPL